MNTIIGIDPSLTNTAVCVLPCDRGPMLSCISTKPTGKGLLERWPRYDTLIQNVMKATRQVPGGVAHSTQEDDEGVLVLIEGYFVGGYGGTAQHLIEYGTLLRECLIRDTVWTPIEVSPLSLKKFITGKGGGKGTDKRALAVAAFKRWGMEYDTDDEVDAHCLALLGAYAMGWREDKMPAAHSPPIEAVLQAAKETAT